LTQPQKGQNTKNHLQYCDHQVKSGGDQVVSGKGKSRKKKRLRATVVARRTGPVWLQ